MRGRGGLAGGGAGPAFQKACEHLRCNHGPGSPGMEVALGRRGEHGFRGAALGHGVYTPSKVSGVRGLGTPGSRLSQHGKRTWQGGGTTWKQSCGWALGDVGWCWGWSREPTLLVPAPRCTTWSCAFPRWYRRTAVTTASRSKPRTRVTAVASTSMWRVRWVWVWRQCRRAHRCGGEVG